MSLLTVTSSCCLVDQSNGLYDFSLRNKDFRKTNLLLTSNSNIVVDQYKEIKCLKESHFAFSGSQDEYIISVVKDREKRASTSKYYLLQKEKVKAINLQNNKIWLVLQYTTFSKIHSQDPKFEGFILQPGEIFRLGRTTFKIIDVHLKEKIRQNQFKLLNESTLFSEKQIRSYNRSFYTSIGKKDTSLVEKISDNKAFSLNIHSTMGLDVSVSQCRICLGGSDEDVLVNVCKCTGTVKYIHLNCLYKWVSQKVEISNYNHLTILNYSQIKCDLCLGEIPPKIKINDSLIYIINPQKLFLAQKTEERFKNFIVLKYITKSHKNDKKLFIINFLDKKRLTLGRSEDNDIKMTENSISHNHCEFFYDNEHIYINDVGSKYGSHILLKKNCHVPLIPQSKYGIQVGRYFLQLCLKEDCLKRCFYLFCGCFLKSKERKNHHKREMEKYYNNIAKIEDKKNRLLLATMINTNAEYTEKSYNELLKDTQFINKNKRIDSNNSDDNFHYLTASADNFLNHRDREVSGKLLPQFKFLNSKLTKIKK